MNYVRHIGIMLVAICAVPTAFAVIEKVEGFKVYNLFYEKSALQKHVSDDGRITTHYIVNNDCEQEQIDDHDKPKAFITSGRILPNVPLRYLQIEGTSWANNEIDGATIPKYAVKDFNGRPIEPSIGFLINREFHALGKWGKRAFKTGVAALIPAALYATYHFSPTAKKKADELYDRWNKLVKAAEKDNIACLKVAGLIVGAGALGYAAYAKSDDIFYKVAMVDKNYFKAYDKKAK